MHVVAPELSVSRTVLHDFRVVVVNIHGQQLWSCRDSQLTYRKDLAIRRGLFPQK